MSEERPAYGDPLFGPGVDPIASSRVKGWKLDSGDDSFNVLVRFWDRSELVLHGERGGELAIGLRGKDLNQSRANELTAGEYDDIIDFLNSADPEWQPIVEKLRAQSRARHP